MKFSYNWIREFVDGLDVPARSLERLITMKTAECEGVEEIGAMAASAVIARVAAVDSIEGSKNVRATVDAGDYGIRTVVCGAPNCRAGMYTAYVPLGVKSIAGMVSDGMLASAAELGISRDHSGIIELLPGQQLPGRDSIIAIDNKSITHRPDLWGHYGMAREVAAITGKILRDPVMPDLLPEAGGPVDVQIEDLALCPRFSALVLENVTVMPSPLWLQQRLTAVGLNPISNIVDLTNFIMAELAQPMHAYDRGKLTGETIWVRPALAGERIVALNDEEYELAPSDLVIADAGCAIGIAGVIGGRGTAISSETTTIVLEAANFQAASVRRTSAALRLRTDASMRFEKSQDPHNTVRALARALELLPQVSPGIRLAGGLADRGAPWREPPLISLDLDWMARKLGVALETDRVRRILGTLQFGVDDGDARVFSVQVPSWRATKDIAMPEDLVEEAGRMIGYDSIDPVAPLVSCAPSFDPPERAFLRRLKRLIAAQGYTEVLNYSFSSEAEVRRFGLAVEKHVRVLNPIAAGQELLRTSLLPGIHRNIVENARHFDQFRIFEIGNEIHEEAGAKPGERKHLAAACFLRDDEQAGLLELKRLAEAIAPGLIVRPAQPCLWEHPARCGALWWEGAEIGRLSEFHPDLIEGGRASVIDVDLELLQELTRPSVSYTPIRRFPTSAFDLSVIAAARDLAGELARDIKQFAGDLAETVEYVREYQGDPVPAGKKSVTFRITAGAADRTLTSDDVTALRTRILTGLSERGYETRV